MDRQRVDQEVERILDRVRHRIVEQASPSLQSMAEMEQLIYSELNRCKPEILQAWCDQAKDDSTRPRCPHCGGPMRHKGSRPRTLICPSGQVRGQADPVVVRRLWGVFFSLWTTRRAWRVIR